MEPKHAAHNCRWAQPEVFVPLPGWIDMWRAPWKCLDEHLLRVALDARPDCATCPRWCERAQPGSWWILSQATL